MSKSPVQGIGRVIKNSAELPVHHVMQSGQLLCILDRASEIAHALDGASLRQVFQKKSETIFVTSAASMITLDLNRFDELLQYTILHFEHPTYVRNVGTLL